MTIVTLFNKLLTNQYLNDSELTFELEVARSLVTISQTSWLSTLSNDSHNDEIHTAAELSYKQTTLGKIFLKQQIPNEEALTKEEMSEKIIIYSQTLKRILVDGLPNKNTSTAKPTHVLEKSYKDLTRILENLPITQKEALTGIEDYITKKKNSRKITR